eukprot:RCo055076
MAFLGVQVSPSPRPLGAVTSGLSSLQEDFDSLAVGGVLPRDLLPVLLRKQCFGSEEIDSVMGQAQSPGAAPQDFNLVEVGQLVTQLLCSRGPASPITTTTTSSASTSAQPLPARVKPTSKLILTVVLLSLMMALTVAGTAVGLDWASSQSNSQASLTRELQLVAQAVGSLIGKNRALDTQLSTARIVSSVIHEGGYNANLQT